MRILLIDSDIESLHKLKADIQEHYVVDVANNSEEGMYLSMTNDYSAIVVEATSVEFCRETRQNDCNIPILMLSSQNECTTRLACLSNGADAVLSKPITSEEITAYLRILISRANMAGNTSVLKIDDLYLDQIQARVLRNGKEVMLRKKEYEILKMLMLNCGRIVSKEKILENVWDMGFEVNSNTLEVHMKSLRDKIDRHFKNKLIKTHYGFGYKIGK